MRTILVVTLAAWHCLLAIAAHAQSTPQSPRGSPRTAEGACGVAAMTEYLKANLALMQQGSPLMSVEAIIAQRRLQEQYCLRFVRCVVSDQTSLRYITAFDSCLRDEALEKYDAEPRTK
jgi:hypothetical protein